MNIFEITVFGLNIAPSYYGLMYVFGFVYGIWALKKSKKYTEKQQENIFIYIFLSVLLGGRIGYVLFYNLQEYIVSPLNIFRVWEGGMSFHGGMLGVVLAIYIFSRRNKFSFLDITDDIARIIPVGIFFGRIGNYINKELLGFEYSGLFAVTTETGSYFPSPLLEALLEGAFIFIILNYIIKKPRFSGQLGSLFLILYGIARTFVELFVRVPDSHIGYYFGFLTQGSLLSIPMIIVGGLCYYYLSNKKYVTK